MNLNARFKSMLLMFFVLQLSYIAMVQSLESVTSPDNQDESLYKRRFANVPSSFIAKPTLRQASADRDKRHNVDSIQPDRSFLGSFLTCFAMIVFSELGDKTFLIAAILAMRHSRKVVFGSAFLALSLMTVLSVALGVLLPSIIPRSWTIWLAAGLFLLFGIKMLREGLTMSRDRIQEDYEEVSHEIENREELLRPALTSEPTLNMLETGNSSAIPTASAHGNSPRSPVPESTAKRLLHDWIFAPLACCVPVKDLISPVFMETFILTFFAEWGDRSQLATIALAASRNFYGITLGAVAGHGMCTIIAVLGGRLLSTVLSIRTGIAFSPVRH